MQRSPVWGIAFFTNSERVHVSKSGACQADMVLNQSHREVGCHIPLPHLPAQLRTASFRRRELSHSILGRSIAERQHDLSDLITGLHVSISLDDFIEAEGFRDLWLQLSAGQLFENVASGSGHSLRH